MFVLPKPVHVAHGRPTLGFAAESIFDRWERGTSGRHNFATGN
jgi:hypothetical protein